MTRRDRRRRQRGAIGITAVLFMIALGGVLALSLNVGHMMKVRNQLQNRVDSAALAGAMELDGTVAQLTSAHNIAYDYAMRHLTDNSDNPTAFFDTNLANAAGGDIVHGVWDFTEPDRSLAFEPATAATPAILINAVQVRSGRSATRGNPLSVFFGNFLGASSASVSAEAVAVSRAPCNEDCPIPIVFADCLFKNPDGSLNCDPTLVFRSSQMDNTGFTNLTGAPPTNPNVVASIIDDWLKPPPNRVCRPVHAGSPVNLQNGNDFKENVWAPLVGRKVTVPVVHLEDCSTNFIGQPVVVGFATFTIGAVHGAPNKSIDTHIDCDEQIFQMENVGCSNFGSLTPFNRLVR